METISCPACKIQWIELWQRNDNKLHWKYEIGGHGWLPSPFVQKWVDCYLRHAWMVTSVGNGWLPPSNMDVYVRQAEIVRRMVLFPMCRGWCQGPKVWNFIGAFVSIQRRPFCLLIMTEGLQYCRSSIANRIGSNQKRLFDNNLEFNSMLFPSWQQSGMNDPDLKTEMTVIARKLCFPKQTMACFLNCHDCFKNRNSIYNSATDADLFFVPSAFAKCFLLLLAAPHWMIAQRIFPVCNV